MPLFVKKSDSSPSTSNTSSSAIPGQWPELPRMREGRRATVVQEFQSAPPAIRAHGSRQQWGLEKGKAMFGQKGWQRSMLSSRLNEIVPRNWQTKDLAFQKAFKASLFEGWDQAHRDYESRRPPSMAGLPGRFPVAPERRANIKHQMVTIHRQQKGFEFRQGFNAGRGPGQQAGLRSQHPDYLLSSSNISMLAKNTGMAYRSASQDWKKGFREGLIVGYNEWLLPGHNKIPI